MHPALSSAKTVARLLVESGIAAVATHEISEETDGEVALSGYPAYVQVSEDGLTLVEEQGEEFLFHELRQGIGDLVADIRSLDPGMSLRG